MLAELSDRKQPLESCATTKIRDDKLPQRQMNLKIVSTDDLAGHRTLRFGPPLAGLSYC